MPTNARYLPPLPTRTRRLGHNVYSHSAGPAGRAKCRGAGRQRSIRLEGSLTHFFSLSPSLTLTLTLSLSLSHTHTHTQNASTSTHTVTGGHAQHMRDELPAATQLKMRAHLFLEHETFFKDDCIHHDIREDADLVEVDRACSSASWHTHTRTGKCGRAHDVVVACVRACVRACLRARVCGAAAPRTASTWRATPLLRSDQYPLGRSSAARRASSL